MTAADVIDVRLAMLAVWPERLVGSLSDEQALFLAGTFAALPRTAAFDAIERAAQRNTPFPPTWPEINAAWHAATVGITTDPETITAEFLGEVERAVRIGGSWRTPSWSDPIIGVSIEHAAGSWREWCLTPAGGEGEGGVFLRNLEPERDERFRRSCRRLLAHRLATGDALPELITRRMTAESLRRIGAGS